MLLGELLCSLMAEVSKRAETMWVASRQVVLGQGEDLRIAPAALRLDGPLIAEVRLLGADPAAELRELGPAGELTDYGDRLVTPAFINAHTHLALGCLRGADIEQACHDNMVEDFFFHLERQLTSDDIRAFTRLGAYESLLAGVGLVWEHYYEAEAVAEALREVGLAGVVAPTLQDLDGPGQDKTQRQLAATEAIAAGEKWRQAGIFAAVGPHATDTVSERLWRTALDLAGRRQLPIHAHLAQSVEEYERSYRRYGRSPVGWLHRIGVLSAPVRCTFAHALYVSHDDLARLSREHHTLVFCPFSQLIFGFPARATAFAEAGLRWAVATDCAANNDSMNVQKELRLAAGQATMAVAWSAAYDELLVQGGPQRAAAVWRERTRRFEAAAPLRRRADLLSRVWSLPGSMHPGFTAGTIEAGALANLLAWDLRHPALWPAIDPLHTLALSDSTGAIHAMLVAGRPVGEAGSFHASLWHSAAYQEARREAEERRVRLLKR